MLKAGYPAGEEMHSSVIAIENEHIFAAPYGEIKVQTEDCGREPETDNDNEELNGNSRAEQTDLTEGLRGQGSQQRAQGPRDRHDDGGAGLRRNSCPLKVLFPMKI